MATPYPLTQMYPFFCIWQDLLANWVGARIYEYLP